MGKIVGGRRWRKRMAVVALMAVVLQTLGWSAASAAPPDPGTGTTEKVIVQFEGPPGKAGRDAIKDVGGKPGKSLPIAQRLPRRSRLTESQS